MIVYLDFDGTVVEHEYPKIGRQNFGCEKVINKLHEKGHQITLNTMRSEFGGDAIDKALNFLHLREIHYDGFMSQKLIPKPWSVQNLIDARVDGLEIYIDDLAGDIPLKSTVMTPHGYMVDWDKVEIDLVAAGIL